MRPLAADERRRVLGALLAEEDHPGDQVGWQLATQEVGAAFVDDDERAAVVVAGRFAVVYGQARPAIGRLLHDDVVFVGTVQGALAALDPRPVIDGLVDDFGTDQVRVFFESDTVRRSAPLELAPLVTRRPGPADDDALRASAGAWVAELWVRPSDCAYARALFDSAGDVLGLAASYAVSPRYAEIAAWVDPIVAGNRIVASQAESFLGEVLDGGHRISSVILTQNGAANRFALGAGWRPCGEQRVVTFPPPLAGSARAWQLSRR